MFTLTEDTKERISKVIEVSRVVIHYGYLPLILYLGAKHAGLPPAAVEAIAGLSAGSAATLVVHPLDIVKTRMQIDRTVAAPSGGSGPRLTARALLRTLLSADRPLAALYRGLTPNLLGNATAWASFFFLKSRIELVLARRKARHSSSSSSPADPATTTTTAQLSAPDFFLASALAGAGTQLVTNPIWVLKTRMLSTDAAAPGAYPSLAAGAARLLRTEGPRGFYRGLSLSLVGITGGAVHFAVYEPVKRLYLVRAGAAAGRGSDASSSSSDGRPRVVAMSNAATLAISSVAKIVAGAVTYPYQVVRSRVQNYEAEQRFGRGVLGVCARLWTEEGIRGFYKGLVPGTIRVLPATWVTFLVYENVKFYLS